ncbi:hypothetical protein ENSA5_54380 [Enhygromyxa salina]|uniref:DUF3540 domain-containing protein n=1 Tax=Enhygromyxa salina TaxID=215803 RepID=A0A2S9XFJ3_9BACT|nr:DUF3540 domain-containing protein [Enhygromyxa salina]PRP91530.1 hypothetical protein ENSA5_54380 [Enhygromyxa salina]
MPAPNLSLLSTESPTEPTAPAAPRTLDGRTRVGTVAAEDRRAWTLSVDDGSRLEAVRAASCLVRPELGDLVLYVAPTPTRAHIIAVLSPREDATTLAVDNELRLHAPAVTVRTGRARLVARELGVLATTIASKFERSTVVGAALDMVTDVFTQRARHSVRSVAGLDRQSAGTIDQRAEGELLVTAKRALVNGDELVKLDAKQLHLG